MTTGMIAQLKLFYGKWRGRYEFFLLVILIPWTMAIAQDDSLIGTWAGKFGLVGIPEDDVRIQFEADGSLVYIQPITLALDSSSDPVQVTLESTGTWSTEGENIWLEVTEWLPDDATLAILIEFAKGLARIAADTLGISDDDYPAYEEAAVAEFMTEFENLGEGMVLEGTFAIEGQVLILALTNEGGINFFFDLQRESMTSVRQTSWGRIKEGI